MIYHYPPVISPSSTINEEPPIDDLIHDLDLINDSLSHLLLFCCNLCGDVFMFYSHRGEAKPAASSV